MTERRNKQILQIIVTDNTFKKILVEGRYLWRGRCIHCRKHIFAELDGRPISDLTIEHIRSRSHGGQDSPENLAISCERCNHQKGYCLDSKAKGDTQHERVVEKILAERAKRFCTQ